MSEDTEEVGVWEQDDVIIPHNVRSCQTQGWAGVKKTCVKLNQGLKRIRRQIKLIIDRQTFGRAAKSLIFSGKISALSAALAQLSGRCL